MKNSLSFPTLYFVVIVISFVSCGNPTLIDTWKPGPSFEKYNWKSLNVRYQVVVGEGSDRKYIGRQFEISDPSTMMDLRISFVTQDSWMPSVPNQKIMLLTMNDGRQWDVDFLFPTKICFTNNSNNKWTYTITLSDTKFYDRLRSQCLTNELQFTPNIKIENIKLCTNVINRDPEGTSETVLPLVPE